MSHSFQRIRQLNNAELHPYPSQFYPESNSQVVPSVGVMLFALPVGRDNIWSKGKDILWGNHGCLPVVTSWHTLQIGLYIWSVGVSHEHQRNCAWVLTLLSSHMHLEFGCVSKGRMQTWGLDACVVQIIPSQLLLWTMSTGDSTSDLPCSSSGRRHHEKNLPPTVQTFKKLSTFICRIKFNI